MMRARTIIAGVVWPIGSVIVWCGACNLLVLVGGKEFVRISAEMGDAVQIAMAIGAVGVAVTMTLLAMRGRLPFTGKRDEKAEGFAVVQR